MATYTPLVTSLGELPEFPEEEKIYDLKVEGGGVPPEANEVFVYVFVTTQGEGSFQRGYYEISTNMLGGPDLKQYMNVATGQGLLAVNSANMWFPVGAGQLKVKLVHPGEAKKSIAGKTDEKDWSGVFIIGYR
ncbi:hypothetical protein ABFA07_001731 [Porites harrisoni]